jgi:hypothetical protein
MFKRENMTLKDLSYRQLKNLINYFERNCTFSKFTYEVTTQRRTIIDTELIFNITFPKSYISKLSEELAIQMILDGSHEHL